MIPEEDVSVFSGAVPLFPLPDVVLFPHTLLPLHVFEPRYREMTERALAGERYIGMALLKPGWEKDYEGNPPIHEVVGIGKILQEKPLEDGRYNILLYGIGRARILEVLSWKPYRKARVEVLRDEEAPAKTGEVRRVHQGLFSIYTALVQSRFNDPKLRPDPNLPLSVLCDVLAAFVPSGIEEKQAVMEELDVVARAGRVLGMLKKSPISRGTPPPPRRWPPRPSQN